MSRRYGMTVEVKRFDAPLKGQIKDALVKEWPFEFFDEHNNFEICGSGESSLCGGMTEEEFSADIAKLVFKVNKKPCMVNVYATYLEELPYETYSFDEEYMRNLND